MYAFAAILTDSEHLALVTQNEVNK